MQKTRQNLVFLFGLAAGCWLAGCGNEVDNTCYEGTIPTNSFYRMLYPVCFRKTMWIEVAPHHEIGKEVQIFTPSPTFPPVPPLVYRNVIEVPIPEELREAIRLDTLFGRTVYFRYRHPTPGETNLFQGNCPEIRAAHPVPLLILSHFSLHPC